LHTLLKIHNNIKNTIIGVLTGKVNIIKRGFFMKNASRILIALIFAVSMTSSAFAGNLENRSHDIGLYGGVLFPGTISIDSDVASIDVDSEMGFTLKGYFDQFVLPMFAVGVYGQYSSTTLTYGDLEVSADMYEFGLTFKPKFMITPTSAIKPGLEIGYRKSTRESFAPDDILTDADGLALNMSAEVQFMLDNGYIFGITLGFITQPTGGNEEADVTWAPIFYALAGIVF